MKWFDVHVGGQKWRVELVKKSHPNLESGPEERVYGATREDKCRIYIAKEQDEQTREDTLLHELLHAVFSVAGCTQELANVVEGADMAVDLEETMVKSITPILHRLLKDLGFRFPKGPGQ
jgi:hypothetical protein